MLKLEPENIIRFTGSSNRTSTGLLRLINPSKKITVIFKVKTTAPKEYCVRPTCGVIEPKGEKSVCIRLQSNQNVTRATKHKFMILSLPCPPGVYEEFGDQWTAAERESGRPQTQKLKSEFNFIDVRENEDENELMGNEPTLSLPVSKSMHSSDEEADNSRNIPAKNQEKSQAVLTQYKSPAESSTSVRSVKIEETQTPSRSVEVPTTVNVKSQKKPIEAKADRRVVVKDIQFEDSSKSKQSLAAPIPPKNMESYDAPANRKTSKSFEMKSAPSVSKVSLVGIERRAPTQDVMIGLICLIVGIFLGKYVL